MKWEYKTIKISKDSNLLEDKPGFEAKELDNFINEFGKDSWELVSAAGIISSERILLDGIYTNTTAVILFFKRPLNQ